MQTRIWASCYTIKNTYFIRTFFLGNEEIQNQPRVVKIYGSMIPSAIKKQKSSLEPFKYNYFGETFYQPKKNEKSCRPKRSLLKFINELIKNEKVLKIYLRTLTCYKEVPWDNCN